MYKANKNKKANFHYYLSYLCKKFKMNLLVLTFVLTFALITLAIAGLSIKSFFIKGGQFNGSCAQNNPLLKNQIGECTLCGKVPEGDCAEPEQNKGGLPLV